MSEFRPGFKLGNFEFRFEEKVGGVITIEPQVFFDERGYFQETFNREDFLKLDIPEFKQDNQSFSKKGVLRGLHIQIPHEQGKLVRVVHGAVLDVAVDVNPRSPTFGNWFSQVLSEQNKKMMYIPTGCAHGFLALEDSVFSYKCTNVYHPGEDLTIRYDDPKFGINWSFHTVDPSKLIISEKDKKGLTFEQYLEKTKGHL